MSGEEQLGAVTEREYLFVGGPDHGVVRRLNAPVGRYLTYRVSRPADELSVATYRDVVPDGVRETVYVERRILSPEVDGRCWERRIMVADLVAGRGEEWLGAQLRHAALIAWFRGGRLVTRPVEVSPTVDITPDPGHPGRG